MKKPLRFLPRPFTAIAAALTLLGLTPAAPAQTAFSLASVDGNFSFQTAAYGITPSVGTSQVLLTTFNPVSSLPANGRLGSSSADTNVTNLNSYFGLAAGTLANRGIQDGSGGLSQTLALTIGTQVVFDFIFFTNEDNRTTGYHNDQAFFVVNGALIGTLGNTASTSAGTTAPDFTSQSRGAGNSGYSRVIYTVPTTGNYTIGFGVGDVTTNTVFSGLMIDNFTYYAPGATVPAIPPAVPEPSAWALLGVGMAGLGVVTLRRRLC